MGPVLRNGFANSPIIAGLGKSNLGSIGTPARTTHAGVHRPRRAPQASRFQQKNQ
jgi:hypothetical protein